MAAEGQAEVEGGGTLLTSLCNGVRLAELASGAGPGSARTKCRYGTLVGLQHSSLVTYRPRLVL
jgi:hypothetical protein